MNINFKRMLLGGLLAGIVILIIGGGLVPLIGHRMDDVLRSRQLPPLRPGAMVFMAFTSLLLGMGAVGLYALIYTLTGQKWKSVFLTVPIYWLFCYFLPNAALVAYGFMPLSLTIIGTAWGILECFAGIIAGAWVYKAMQKT